MRRVVCVLVACVLAVPLFAQSRQRFVIIDQDGAGPAGSDQMSMLSLLQAPQADVLGITIVTGDVWRDEGVQHTLRMLELTGHGGVPVVPGAVLPLVRTEQETRLDISRYGRPVWLGAWNDGGHAASVVPPLAEGTPALKAAADDAAHFMIRQVHAHPGAVTIYAAGPLTNVALALAIDPGFAQLTQGIVLMGGSLNPQTADPEFATTPRFEFNFWFDPEATRKVLRAAWPSLTVTTVDVSIKTKLTAGMVNSIARASTPAARYVATYEKEHGYMWDELAACAWLDPTIITKSRDLYLDVDLSHGPGYGHTLTWTAASKPAVDMRLAHVQVDVDVARFAKMFVELMTRR